MKIQVLGSGCPTCKKLRAMVEQAVFANGLPDKMEYITDIKQIIEMGITQTPALVLDGKVVAAGRVPGADELKQIIALYRK